MARKTRAKPAKSAASSWWAERSKILAKESKPKAKKTVAKRGTKKVAKAEKGDIYFCDTCGCEMVCVEPGAEEIICCGEPMELVC